MNKNQGSITVYLCLTLTILLSLFGAMLQSVRTACGRVAVVSAMDQGLFSLFAQYDRPLLEEYDLFYLDGGYGNSKLEMNRLYETVQRDAMYSLNPYGHENFLYRNFFGTDFTSGSITGYVLAVDQTGNSFTRQVSEYMKQRLGVIGIRHLSEIVTRQSGEIKTQNIQKQQIFSEDPVTVYEKEKHTQENSRQEDPQPPAEESKPDMVNPIEVIQKIQKQGILTLVTTDSSDLSDAQADLSAFPSRRKLQQGMGLITKKQLDITDKLLMSEYILDKFPCYTSQQSSDGLKYQAEYAIAGKTSDTENLKAVVYRLAAVRETANLLYLYSSPSKKAQADALATTLASALLLPVAQPIISLALLSCWAFAESLLDIRELLKGGKISLLKNDQSWQLSLENLPDILSHLDDSRKSDTEGFDYTWYLRFLLFTKSQSQLTSSAMDLVEYNMNQKYPEQLFRIDNCVESLEIEAIWSLNGRDYTVCRNYGYLETTSNQITKEP